MNEFDEKMNEYKKTLIIGQEMSLRILLKKIEVEDYTTVAQIKGAIHNVLEILECE